MEQKDLTIQARNSSDTCSCAQAYQRVPQQPLDGFCQGMIHPQPCELAAPGSRNEDRVPRIETIRNPLPT